MKLESTGASSDDKKETADACLTSLQHDRLTVFPGVEGTIAEVSVGLQSKIRKNMTGFGKFGLSNEITRGIAYRKYSNPTPIQRRTIPLLLQRKDAIVMARTGSGKTAAFLIPMLQLLSSHSEICGIRGMILSPTRELALQTAKFLRDLSKFTSLRNCVLVGGDSLEEQFTNLANNPDVVVATPGRLLHVLSETKLQLSLIEMLILDEGDRLFEQGFQSQITEIMYRVPQHCQKAIFSATMPSILSDFATARLSDATFVRLESETKLPDTLSSSFFVIREDERIPLLLYLLQHVLNIERETNKNASTTSPSHHNKLLGKQTKHPNPNTASNHKQALVFLPTKYHVEYCSELLRLYGYQCSALHGSMDQEARKEAMGQFIRKHTTLLLVTDLAARGIDIPALDYVLNVSFPHSEKLFIHRGGRVARAGAPGVAFSFVASDELPYLMNVRNKLKLEPSEKGNSEQQNMSHSVEYGKVPANFLKPEHEWLEMTLRDHAELMSLRDTANKGYKQYKRSRPVCAHALYAEGRELMHKLAIHSELERIREHQTEKNVAVENVSSFRGGGAIFQAKNQQNLSESKKNSFREALKFISNLTESKHKDGVTGASFPNTTETTNNKTDLHGMLDTKIGKHEKIPVRPTGKKSSIPKNEKKWNRSSEEAYYISSEPCVTAVEDTLENVADDLCADSAEAMNSLRSVYAWNKKTKKYVKEDVGRAKLMLRGLRNEAGSKIKIETDRKTFSKWMLKTKMQIPDVGEKEHVRNYPEGDQTCFSPFAMVKGKKKRLRGKQLEQHMRSAENKAKKKMMQKKRHFHRN